jgi:hypothetical protein
MWESQLVITNVEEDVLATGVRHQRRLLSDCIEAIEARDVSAGEIIEMLMAIEKNLRRTRIHFARRHMPVK